MNVEVEDVLATWRSMNTSAMGGLVVIIAVGFVALLALVWAVFFRKKRRRRRSHHHSHRHSSDVAERQEKLAEVPADPPPREHRHGRRSRRRHRARNPTLAETGGLPPIRPEDPSAPPA